jgi:RecG-like helicase
VPVYEELAGMTSRQLRRIIASALADLADPLWDPIPENIPRAGGIPDLRVCLQRNSFPDSG